jgi:MerR family transcriptional regulator, copper efflux regulator
MRIGEIARQTNVSIQTLRFYERKGFLPPPARSAAGYRAYSSADLWRVNFIRQSQQVGFPLKEIKELLDIHEHFSKPRRAPTARWHRAVRIARQRLALIDKKILALAAMRAQLEIVLGDAADTPQEHCPVAQPKQTPVLPSAAGKKSY